MAEKKKTPIQVLRDKKGGMSPELREYFKEHNSARKLLAGALKGSAKTIPELSSETGLKSDVTMWHVMAMKRYGRVVEERRSGDYFKYALKEGS